MTVQTTLHDVLGAPLPPAPAYGSNSIADVLESASSLVAQRSLARPAHALDSDPAFNSVADPLNLAGRLTEQDIDPGVFPSRLRGHGGRSGRAAHQQLRRLRALSA